MGSFPTDKFGHKLQKHTSNRNYMISFMDTSKSLTAYTNKARPAERPLALPGPFTGTTKLMLCH